MLHESASFKSAGKVQEKCRKSVQKVFKKCSKVFDQKVFEKCSKGVNLRDLEKKRIFGLYAITAEPHH